MEIEEIKKEVARIVREELKRDSIKHRAFFFGSRISGTASPRSDLDVGIEGKEALSSDIFRSIKTRCEALPTLYSIDIVDFANIGDDFKKVALRHTEEII